MGCGDIVWFELDQILRLVATFDSENIKNGYREIKKDANEVIVVTFVMAGGVIGFGPRVVVGLRDAQVLVSAPGIPVFFWHRQLQCQRPFLLSLP